MSLLALWLMCGIGTAIVASNRGASGCLWFALGVGLGPVGFALAFTNGRRCPYCSSRISTRARVCPRCQRPLLEPKPARESRPVAPTPVPPPRAPSGVCFCSRCGHPQSAENPFCSACGQPLHPGYRA